VAVCSTIVNNGLPIRPDIQFNSIQNESVCKALLKSYIFIQFYLSSALSPVHWDMQHHHYDFQQ